MEIENIVEHHWKPMEEFRLEGEDFLDWIEEDKIEILKKLKPNQYIRFGKINIKAFNLVLDKFREEGLDIGKGNCEYGYRMPIKQNRSEERELIIFRRY
ncbi:MAG: hypothetical protein WC584_05215 [Candidatus Pacearchaeota archaeon]